MGEKVVIFDWGGVLMRTEDYTPRHGWDNRLGQPTGFVESIVHGIPEWEQVQQGKLRPDEYWSAVQGKLNLTDEDAKALADTFYSGDQLDPTLIALIRRLRADGVPVGLLSNNSPALTAEIEALGLVELFSAEVVSAAIGVMKPDPAAYHAILDKMDAQAEDALFIDDSPINVDGARRVGMKAILFRPDVALGEMINRWLAGVEV